MAYRILTDTCYWLGLIDKSDQHHRSALSAYEQIKMHDIIVPWPCLYETISTHLCKNKIALDKFEQELLAPNVIKYNDHAYNEAALIHAFAQSKKGFTTALVDCILIKMIEDVDLDINGLVTFNGRDFEYLAQIRDIMLIGNEKPN